MSERVRTASVDSATGGILAVWHRDGAPHDPDGVARALARFASVPHAVVGSWVDGPTAMAQRHLHAPLAGSSPVIPPTSRDGSCVAAVDARLDNRAELIANLGLESDAGAIGDDAIVLHAWLRWGTSCPEHLLGDFAFAIWDPRRRRLFCARDHLGCRPLYYHLGPRIAAVASDTSTLIAVAGVPDHLDEVRVAGFLVPGFADRTRTFYGGISRLPAAHALVVEAERGESPSEYWSLDPGREHPAASDAEHAEAFRALFTESVRARLRGTSPAVAALSGGLDSSSVVCVARELRRASGVLPLETWSARFPSLPGCDEGAYIASVVEQGDILSREIRGDRLDPLGDLERGFPAGQDTLHGAGYYMHEALYRAARGTGAVVFLEGMTGDAVVSHGTGYLRSLLHGGRWLTLAREIAHAAHGGPSPPPLVRTATHIARELAPRSARRAWHRARGGGRAEAALLRPEFARRVQLEERLRAAAGSAPPAGVDVVRAAHQRVITSAMFANVLETLAGMAASAGVEARDPFADRRLVEFCLALPTSQKIGRGITRVVLRRALADVLPRAVLERRDKGRLDLMLTVALDRFGTARLERLIDGATRALEPFVEPGRVHQAYRAYLSSPTEANRNRVWRVAALGNWLVQKSLPDVYASAIVSRVEVTFSERTNPWM